MSTSIDAPPVAPGPPEGPEEPGDGLTWVQRELQRRMAERGPGRGGRHARRDVDEPPRGVDHVPRHAVATPGPGVRPPAPIGGPPRPGPDGPAAASSGWSWPGTDPRIRDGDHLDGAPAGRPAADLDPVVRHPPARPGPPPSALPSPGVVRPVAAVGPDTRPPVSPPPVSPPPVSPPPVSPPPVSPLPAAAPRPAEPAIEVEPDEVLGGPSRAGRPAPRAFRRRRVDVRGILDEPPAHFGGPGFHEPDTYEPPEPQQPDTFGGPAFALPAARTVPDVARPPTERPAAERPAGGGPAGDRAGPTDVRTEVRTEVAAAEIGLAIVADPAPMTIATGPAADVLPPREPARLLAAPPVTPEVETTTRIDPVPGATPGSHRTHDDYDDDLDGDDLHDGEGVLWSRDAAAPPPVASPSRTLVVLSERRARARPVRNAETLQEGSVVGELLRTDLIRTQLGLALRYALFAGLLLGLLPPAFALFPVIGETEVFGFRLPWVLLGVAVYPFLWVLGRLHTRSAERIEQKFADQVQD